jgi:hypothetical protein
MIQISPVIHLYENEIQPQIVCSPTTVVVKFHTNCDLFSLFEFLKQRLTESEWQVFYKLWTDDSADRSFEIKDGYLVIC